MLVAREFEEQRLRKQAVSDTDIGAKLGAYIEEAYCGPLRIPISPICSFLAIVFRVRKEVWLHGQAGISAFQGEEKSPKSWWFAIASNLCLNQLGKRKRWRIDAHFIGEQELDSEPEQLEQLAARMSNPSFRYEAAEHISFCLSFVVRSLDLLCGRPSFLREIFDFTNQEAARILGFWNLSSAINWPMPDAHDQCLRWFMPAHQQNRPLLSCKFARSRARESACRGNRPNQACPSFARKRPGRCFVRRALRCGETGCTWKMVGVIAS